MRSLLIVLGLISTALLSACSDLGFFVADTVFSAAGSGTTPESRPIVSAGPDQIVTEGDMVLLHGSAELPKKVSTSDPIAYAWSQTGGSTVHILSPAIDSARFVAPPVNEAESLSFRLSAFVAGEEVHADTVTILVEPAQSAD